MGRKDTRDRSLRGLWRAGRYFWPYVRQSRFVIAGGFLALLAQMGFGLLEPWPLKFVIDRIIVLSPEEETSSIAFLDNFEPMTLLAVLALALVVIIGLRALSTWSATVSFTVVGNRVMTGVRDDLFDHLQHLSLSYHKRARGGDLLLRLTSDISLLREVAIRALLPMIGSVLILLGMMAVMLWLNWQLALVAFALVPVSWLAIALLGRRIREVSRRERRQEGKMASAAAESMAAIATVQALSLERGFAGDVSRRGRRIMQQRVKARRLQAGIVGVVDMLTAIATALVLWFGARLVLDAALTAGELLVFLAYLTRSYKPQRDLARYMGRLTKASAAGERIVDVLEATPDVRDLPGAFAAPPFEGRVVYDDVKFSYEPGRCHLDGIRFQIEPGEHIALVGPSGGGKSTMISLLLRLYDPDEGRVMIDGHDIRDYTIESLRSQISTVLQDGLLFAASIRDNIASGNDDIKLEEIISAARLANADGFIRALPEGYNTRLGGRGVTLSAGQRQRVTIARAALHKTPILILDEPTTSLDEGNRNIIVGTIESLWKNRTTILTTHDLRLARLADRIFCVEDGRIIESGTHDELIQAGGRYATHYRMQEMGGSDDAAVSPLEEISHAFSS